MTNTIKKPHVEVGEHPGYSVRNTHQPSGSNTNGSWETVPGVPIQTLEKAMRNSIIVVQGYILGRCSTKTIQLRVLVNGDQQAYVASNSKVDAYLGINAVVRNILKGNITVELQWRGQDNATTANISDFSPRGLIAYEVGGGVSNYLSSLKDLLGGICNGSHRKT